MTDEQKEKLSAIKRLMHDVCDRISELQKELVDDESLKARLDEADDLLLRLKEDLKTAHKM